MPWLRLSRIVISQLVQNNMTFRGSWTSSERSPIELNFDDARQASFDVLQSIFNEIFTLNIYVSTSHAHFFPPHLQPQQQCHSTVQPTRSRTSASMAAAGTSSAASMANSPLKPPPTAAAISKWATPKSSAPSSDPANPPAAPAAATKATKPPLRSKLVSRDSVGRIERRDRG